MRKEQAKAWIEKGTQNLKDCKWHGEYIEGFKEGCETFLDWLVQQGVIKT